MGLFNGLKQFVVRILNRPLVLEYGKKITAMAPKPLYDLILKTYLEKCYRPEYRLEYHDQHYQKAVSLGLFDEAYYRLNNPQVLHSGLSPINHYLNHGWRNLLRPSLNFDPQWYVLKYLNNSFGEVDPLAHHIKIGLAQGHHPRPPHPPQFRAATPLAEAGAPPRRICLFAGYEAQGRLDDYVVEYIKELSKFSDVYYLADSDDMTSDELQKLAGLTKGAWAIRHGAHDFGSYALLMNKLVGWETIEKYDELLLVNDSCYLLRPLDNVFRQMAARPCAWWGLQATKGLHGTIEKQLFPKNEPICLDKIKKTYLETFEDDYIYDFHMASYFLAFRKEVIQDRAFRNFFMNITPETNRLMLTRRYEIGLTRLMIFLGYDFAAFCDQVYPRQPVFTDLIFELIADGFPLLKRNLLQHNHYGIPGLENWQTLLKSVGVTRDLTVFEKVFFRTFNQAQFYNNQRSTKDQSGQPIYPPPLSCNQIQDLDPGTPKYDHWWAFPVCAFNHQLDDNTRALFEHVKNDPQIKKIILTRSKEVEANGVNVKVVPLQSREGQFYLLRSRQIFLKHDLPQNVGYNISGEHHNLYNLWHGIPLKRINYTSLDQTQNSPRISEENRKLKAVIAASQVDRLARAASFWPLTYNDIWVTGLPRHDFINCGQTELPESLQDDLARLEALVSGRRFLLFVPTFRNNQLGGYYPFSPKEVKKLAAFLKANNLVLGIREHLADQGSSYAKALVGEDFINVSANHFSCVEVLYRRADLLLTDYSSAFVDFLHTNRPVVSFAYDADNYISQERGLFYDLNWAFPGPIAETFGELMEALDQVAAGLSAEEKTLYAFKKKIFLDHEDAHNSRRLVQKITDNYQGNTSFFSQRNISLESKNDRQVLWIYNPKAPDFTCGRILNTISRLVGEGWDCKAVPSDAVSAQDFVGPALAVISRVVVTDTLRDLYMGFQQAGGQVVADLGGLYLNEEAGPKWRGRYKNYCSFMAHYRLEWEAMMYCVEEADAVVASSKEAVEALKQLGYQATLIPNAIENKKYLPETEAPDHLVRIACLSELKSHQADLSDYQETLIRLLAENPQVELHLIGQAPFPIKEKALDRIINHGLLSYNDRGQVLQDMDLCLLPFGPAESAYCETEIISLQAATSLTPSLIGQTENWPKTLNQLVSDPSARLALGQKAKQLAVEKHDLENSAQLFGKLFKHLVG